MSKPLLSCPVAQHFPPHKGAAEAADEAHIAFHNALINGRLRHDLTGFWDAVRVPYEARLDSGPDVRDSCHGPAPRAAA